MAQGKQQVKIERFPRIRLRDNWDTDRRTDDRLADKFRYHSFVRNIQQKTQEKVWKKKLAVICGRISALLIFKTPFKCFKRVANVSTAWYSQSIAKYPPPLPAYAVGSYKIDATDERWRNDGHM